MMNTLITKLVTIGINIFNEYGSEAYHIFLDGIESIHNYEFRKILNWKVYNLIDDFDVMLTNRGMIKISNRV